MTRAHRRWTLPLLAALAVVVALWFVYGSTDITGFYYDDYHFVRPPISTELHRVWFGSWDVTGIEAIFFRPLTTLMFLGRFWLFGVNATALHAVTLIGQVSCAGLVALFLRRAGISGRGSAIGALLYVVYPTFPYSQTSWLTNQMHLAESCVVLIGLLVWQAVTPRRRWLMPVLAALAVVVFLLKEDGVMFLVVICVLAIVTPGREHALDRRTRVVGLCLAATIVAALVLFRQDRLGAIGGYGRPEMAKGVDNLLKGLTDAVLLWPTRRPWQGVASVFAVLASVLVAIQAGRARRYWLLSVALILTAFFGAQLPSLLLPRANGYPLLAAQGLSSGVWLAVIILGGWSVLTVRSTVLGPALLAGCVIALCFDAPFALVSKREQFHLISLGAVVCGAVCIEALLLRSRSGIRWTICVALAVLAPLAVLARSQAEAFDSCSDLVRSGDEAVAGWWVVPTEVKLFLAQKPALCASGRLRPLTELDQIWWGTLAPTPDDGESYRWTGDRATSLIRANARRATFELRTPRPASVTVSVDGEATPVSLPVGVWTPVSVPLTTSLHVSIRRSHRIDIDVASWFVPADEDAASTDLRRHGVQLRAVRID
jgi:hypothetical protein